MRRTQHLRQLLRDAQYFVDAQAVAEAIVARARARSLIPGVAFRNDGSDVRVRSFRPSSQARSFRPCRGRAQVAMGVRR